MLFAASLKSAGSLAVAPTAFVVAGGVVLKNLFARLLAFRKTITVCAIPKFFMSFLPFPYFFNKVAAAGRGKQIGQQRVLAKMCDEWTAVLVDCVPVFG
jgi:hypothetical protein